MNEAAVLDALGRIRTGDEGAFNELASQIDGSLQNFAARQLATNPRLTSHGVQAGEVANELHMKILSYFGDPAKVPTTVAGLERLIAKLLNHVVIDIARSIVGRGRKRPVKRSLDSGLIPWQSNWLSAFQGRMDARDVFDRFRAAEPEHAGLLMQYWELDGNAQRLAEALACSVATAFRRLAKAIASLSEFARGCGLALSG